MEDTKSTSTMKMPTKKKLRKKKLTRRSTPTLPCCQDAEARTIANREHHYLKSKPQQKRQQLKPLYQHTRHRDTP